MTEAVWVFLGGIVSGVVAIIVAVINGRKTKAEEQKPVIPPNQGVDFVNRHVDYLVAKIEDLEQEVKEKSLLAVENQRLQSELAATKHELRDARRELQKAGSRAETERRELEAAITRLTQRVEWLQEQLQLALKWGGNDDD